MMLRLVASVCLSLFVFAGGELVFGATYSVGIRFLPERIDPLHTQTNTDRYILMHLYYPLFQMSDGNRLESEFLDMGRTRALTPDFRSFQLCLRNSLRFSSGVAITAKHLRSSLLKAHELQENLLKIEEMKADPASNECIIVRLFGGDPNYFDKLTTLTSTVLAGDSVDRIPVGLGPYRLKSHSSDEIVLQAVSGRIRGNIQTVRFHKFETAEQSLAHRIDDWNHIYQIEIPDVVKSTFQRVESPTYKVYALVINWPNPAERREMARCLVSEKFTELFGLSLRPTPGFLPRGMPGWDVDFMTLISGRSGNSECKARPNVKAIPLLNWRVDVHAALKSQKATFEKRLPLKLALESIDPADLRELGFDRKPKMVLVGFDTSGSSSAQTVESSVFFESFFRETRIVDKAPPGLEAAVRSAAQATSADQKKQLYAKAHRILLESGYIVPLGQMVSHQFYPKSISGIAWADRISGYPRIDRIRKKE